MKYNIFNPIISWVIKRINRINNFVKFPIKTQKELLKYLIKKSQNTIWGKSIILKKSKPMKILVKMFLFKVTKT